MTDQTTPPPSGDNGGTTTAPWYAGIENPDLRGLAEIKKWDSPEKALESYRALESKLGAPPDRLLKLPEKPDDPAWAEIHKKLGFAAPEKAEEYELPVPEGFNQDYAQAVAAKAKELGIPKHMLKGLAEFNNEFIKSALDADDKAREQRVSTAIAELRMDWAGQYEQTMALAQRAESLVKAEVGLSDESLKAWQEADPKGYFKLLGHYGSRLAEARKIDGVQTGGGEMQLSPEAAKVKLRDLMQDKDWFQRWERQDVQARAEWKQLNAIIAGTSSGR